MIRSLLLLMVVTLGSSQECAAQLPQILLRNGTAKDVQRAIEYMKKDPTRVNTRDSDERTPLHVAARFNHIGAVKWLLDNGADVDAQDDGGMTPLHWTEDPEIVRLILLKKPNLNLESNRGTAPQMAIEDLRASAEVADKSQDDEKRVGDLRKIVAMYVEQLGDDIDLISAIRLGRLDRVREITSIDPSAAHGRKNRPNPLREAADWGRLEICRYLVEKCKCDVNDFKGGSGYPVILSALKHPKVVQYLIKQGADLERRINWEGGRTGVWIIGDDATPLHFAASDGVPETLTVLLDAGVDPLIAAFDSFEKEKQQTALEVAAYFGRTDNALAILRHPAFKNADQTVRQRALDDSFAAVLDGSESSLEFESQDRSELLEALISHGARFNSNDSEYSPLQIVVSTIYSSDDEKYESKRGIVAVLKKHGYELDLFAAVAIGDYDTLAKLLKADPKAANSYSINGFPALHIAIEMRYPKAVQMLIDSGCDIEIRGKGELADSANETALLCATSSGHEEIARMLLEAGADVNAKSGRDITPLHEAVRRGNLGIAKLLLESGASQFAEDRDGNTPLEWAKDEKSIAKFGELFSRFEDSQKDK